MVGWETKGVEGPYSRVDDVPLIVESIFADPEASSSMTARTPVFLPGVARLSNSRRLCAAVRKGGRIGGSS